MPASWTRALTQVAHWSYGIGWGCGVRLLRGRIQTNAAPAGLGFGIGVWAASYVQLVPLGIYELPWEYPPLTLAEDISYHLVYGVGVAGTYADISD